MDTLRELKMLIDRYTTGGRHITAIPRVSLLRLETSTSSVPLMFEPVLCIVANGSRRVMLGDKVFEYDPGAYLTTALDLPANAAICKSNSDQPFLSFGLLLNPDILASLMLEIHEYETEESDEVTLGMSVELMSEDLLQAVVRLLRLLERPRDIRFLAPLAEREILYLLLRSSKGNMLRQLARDNSRLKQISRATQWLRRNYAKPFRMEVLAEAANMSVASLQRYFKIATNMSPLQYQKQIRLREARRLLLENAGDAATIGFRVGYGSATQFSREYHREFGSPPGRDAQRLRSEERRVGKEC